LSTVVRFCHTLIPLLYQCFTEQITTQKWHCLSGSLKTVDYIDVANQDEGQMTMGEWTEYFTSSDRPKILNVLSLELTGTRCRCSEVWYFIPLL